MGFHVLIMLVWMLTWETSTVHLFGKTPQGNLRRRSVGAHVIFKIILIYVILLIYVAKK